MFRYSCTEKAKFKLKGVLFLERILWLINSQRLVWGKCVSWLTLLLSFQRALWNLLHCRNTKDLLLQHLSLRRELWEGSKQNRAWKTLNFDKHTFTLPQEHQQSVVINSRAGKETFPIQSSEKSVTQSISVLLCNISVADLMLSVSAQATHRNPYFGLWTLVRYHALSLVYTTLYKASPSSQNLGLLWTLTGENKYEWKYFSCKLRGKGRITEMPMEDCTDRKTIKLSKSEPMKGSWEGSGANAWRNLRKGK